jgi:LPLT family lysophospholipid transporter-like MFS transporter
MITNGMAANSERGQQSQRRAFFTVVGAHFLSSLADNALLILAIGLLAERHASGWTTPALRLVFYLSFVLMAAYAGAIADSAPKGRILFFSSIVKFVGCILLLVHLHPLFAYALIGFGAAAYGPARFGILPELLASEALVKANAWIEVSSVFSILLGVVLGSVLMDERIITLIWSPSFLFNGSRAMSGVVTISLLYFSAIVASAAIPLNPASDPTALTSPNKLQKKFADALKLLLHDHEAQISLGVTSLFWAVSATLQFLILQWAENVLRLTLSQSALLQVAVAAGVIVGAIVAGRWVKLHQSLSILPVGFALSVGVGLMIWVNQTWVAILLLLVIGTLAGSLLIPMNALLQQRGYRLMHPGQSIAVQNFCEHLASLTLLALYGLLVYLDAPILPIIGGLALLITACMIALINLHQRNLRTAKSFDGFSIAAKSLR